MDAWRPGAFWRRAKCLLARSSIAAFPLFFLRLCDKHCVVLWRCLRCHDLAVKTFRYAIQLEPNFPDAYNNLGNALRESGQLEVGWGSSEANIFFTPLWEQLSRWWLRVVVSTAALWGLVAPVGSCGCLSHLVHRVVSVRMWLVLVRRCFRRGGIRLPCLCVSNETRSRLLVVFRFFRDVVCSVVKAPLPSPARFARVGVGYRVFASLMFFVSFPLASKSGCASQEAINCYRTTLRLKPDHPHAYNNLGNAMKDKVRARTHNTA